MARTPIIGDLRDARQLLSNDRPERGQSLEEVVAEFGADPAVFDVIRPEDAPTEFIVGDSDEDLEDAEVAEPPEPTGAAVFDANLAEFMEPADLTKIAGQITEAVERDLASRSEWSDWFKKGLEILGLKPDQVDDGPFPGASTVTSSLLGEAIVQFQARAIAELFPPNGPVRTKIMGTVTREKEERAHRIKSYMNYQCIYEDEGYFEGTDKMLMWVPMHGSVFKKSFRDTLLDQTASIVVKGEDLIVPYSAENLDKAPRFTHRLWQTQNEIRKLQNNGQYRKVAIPAADDLQLPEGQVEEKEIENRGEAGPDDDAPNEIWETYIDLALDIDPHLGDDGKPTGIALPYVVTMDRESETILAIRRNWHRNDTSLYKKRVYFSHYYYLPGFGFYGLGLLHLIGGIAQAHTGIIRLIIDGGAFASLQGGFKTKSGARLDEGSYVVEPGKYKDVDATFEELDKAFYTPNYREPSPALIQLLSHLLDMGRRFGSITEAMTGDAPTQSPVGTTVALIEQGSKVFSSIHKRLHKAQAHELRTRYEINADFIPDEGYPYQVEGEEGDIYPEDFDGSVEVVPVSDPNIFSSTQRVAMCQTVLALAEQAPDLYDREEAHRRMLSALNVPEQDALLKDKSAIQPMDAVQENAALLMGKPIKAFIEQDHLAHIRVHLAFFEAPGFGGNPEVRKAIEAMMRSHIADHLAYSYGLQMRQMGIPVVPFAPDTEQEGETTPADHEMQNLRTQLAAQVSAAVEQFIGLPQMEPPDPVEQKAKEHEQKLAHREREHAQRMTHREEDHRQEMRHEEEEHAQEQAESFVDTALKGAEAQERANDAALSGARPGQPPQVSE